MPDTSHKVHAVEKAIALLDCFWREKRPMTLTELRFATDWAAHVGAVPFSGQATSANPAVLLSITEASAMVMAR